MAADADPNTGVAVYDTYSEGGWLEVGGTSASSPMIAATFALGGTPTAGSNPATYIYSHTGNLFDVPTGSQRQVAARPTSAPARSATTARPAGAPRTASRRSPRATTPRGNTVTVTNPGSQSGTVGTAVSLQIQATDSASGQTLTYSATGLPAGLSINPRPG